MTEPADPSTRRAFLGLGSNLGDSRAILTEAVATIEATGELVAVSSVYETEPVGGPDQDPFLNLVVELATTSSPRELLELCRRLETVADRVRTIRWGPRTLDVDVLLVGDLTVDTEDLVVPHPRMHQRNFVMVPLLELAPDLEVAGYDPVTTIGEVAKAGRLPIRSAPYPRLVSKPIRPDLQAPRADIRFLVERALAEDLTPLGDLTSSLLDPTLGATANINARQAGVLAGCACVEETFAAVDPNLTIDWHLTDGDRLQSGDTIATTTGAYATLLTAERTALNFLSHLSGVATNANRWVEIAAGRVTVWDTRKTTPGYRSLQKAAVRAGGAANHRSNLSDWLMLKDNHLVGTDITAAVALARRRWPGRTIHVEADREDQALEALAAGADIILLDNFTPAELSELVPRLRAWQDEKGDRAENRCMLEASGGITLDSLDAYADTGVDLVSSGSITNSAPVLDIGLDVVPNP